MLEIFLSIGSSVILGFILGLEREITNKNAGLRTHILVCMGACVFTLLSVYGFPTFVSGDNYNPHANGIRDTARIAAQVVTGIGFIGAGTVLRHGSSVRGLTTAATLWMAASIGMACGAERYDIAIIGTIFSVFVLVLIKYFERKILIYKKVFKKSLKFTIVCENNSANKIQKYITDNFIFLKELKKNETDEACCTKIVAVVDIKSNNPIQSLYKDFEKFNGIKSIFIREAHEQEE